MSITVSRRDVFTGAGALGASLAGGGSGLLKGLTSMNSLSVSSIFDAIQIPRGLRDGGFLLEFGFSPGEYLALKEKYRLEFEQLISYVPSHMLECIDYDQSFFNRPSVFSDNGSLPNEGLFIQMCFESPNSSRRVNISLSSPEESVRFCMWDMLDGRRQNQQSLTPVSFSQAMGVLNQPFDSIVEQIGNTFRMESSKRSIESKKAIEEIEEKGYLKKYYRFLNNTALTPISQIVTDVVNNENPFDLSVRHGVWQILTNEEGVKLQLLDLPDSLQSKKRSK